MLICADDCMLPPQAITSCASGTTGCNTCSTCGGNPQQGFAYALTNGGLANNVTYPFVGLTYTSSSSTALETDACNAVLESQIQATISGYCSLPVTFSTQAVNPSVLQQAVSYQVHDLWIVGFECYVHFLTSSSSPSKPVSVAVAASSFAFQYYQGGVLTSSSECGTSIDHAILAVGYDTTTSNQFGTPFWKLQVNGGCITTIRDYCQ